MANLNRGQQSQQQQKNFNPQQQSQKDMGTSKNAGNKQGRQNYEDQDADVAYTPESDAANDPSIQRMQGEGGRQPQGTKTSSRSQNDQQWGKDVSSNVGNKKSGASSNRSVESDTDSDDTELESSDRSDSSAANRKQRH